MKAIDEIQESKQLADDMKDQVRDNVTSGKDFMNTVKEVKQEMPLEMEAIG